MEITKGEWKVKPYTASVFGNQAALSCFEVWAGEHRIASTINEANAHLIAQAPKLYEALDAIITHFRKLDKLYSKDLEMLNLGSRVLAKVEE